MLSGEAEYGTRLACYLWRMSKGLQAVILAGISAAAIAAFLRRSDPLAVARSQTVLPALRIAVLGPHGPAFIDRTASRLGLQTQGEGDSRTLTLRGVEKEITLEADGSRDLVLQSRLLGRNQAGLAVVDATLGPTADFREEVLLTRQAGRALIIGFNRCAQVKQASLRDLFPLALEECLRVADVHEAGRVSAILCDDAVPGTSLPETGSFPVLPASILRGKVQPRVSVLLYLLSRGEFSCEDVGSRGVTDDPRRRCHSGCEGSVDPRTSESGRRARGGARRDQPSARASRGPAGGHILALGEAFTTRLP